jgi:predicted ATP-dependent endonuclease of OLD family
LRLSTVEIAGYRRFAEKQVLRLDTKLTAFVGPNEAGKSSLLLALRHIGREGPFEQTEAERELTRLRVVEPRECIIRADFALSQDDQEALASVVANHSAIWGLTFRKYGDGSGKGKLRTSNARTDISALW